MDSRTPKSFEYIQDELKSFDLGVLEKIAEKYGINNENLPRRDRRLKLINKILEIQDKLENEKEKGRSIISKEKRENIIKKIESALDEYEPINKVPLDALRLMAYNLEYHDLLHLCATRKRFSQEICNNNIFQKEYGLRHLSSKLDRLPKDKGQYKVLDELRKLAARNKGGININDEIVLKGYELYLEKIIGNLDKRSKNEMLFIAARKGYLDIVKYLLRQGANINANQDISLDTAARNGHLDVVEFLVENGANIDSDQYSAVESAALEGHFDVVKYLVEKEPASINIAFRTAAGAGHLDIMKYLLQKGADIHIDNDEAVEDAVYNGFLDVIKYLVEKGVDISGDKGNDILLIAARRGKLNVVKYLLENNIGTNIIDEAFSNAAKGGHLEVLKYLVENGAEFRVDRETISYAVEGGNLDTLKYLVENGTNIDKLMFGSISIAIRRDHLDVLKYIMENAKFDDKMLAKILLQSVKYHKQDILEYLESIGVTADKYLK